jgi:hypothetical protein
VVALRERGTITAEKGGVLYAIEGDWQLPDGTRFGKARVSGGQRATGKRRRNGRFRRWHNRNLDVAAVVGCGHGLTRGRCTEMARRAHYFDSSGPRSVGESNDTGVLPDWHKACFIFLGLIV